MPPAPDLPLEGFKQVQWERYCQLCAVVLLWYEYMITWNEELEFFWKKRWSFGKCLFLWSRYYSLFYNLANATIFMQHHPSLDVSGRFFHWQNTGAALQVITTHTVLCLRLYAMYSSSKKVLVILLLCIAADATTMGVIFGISKPGGVGTNNPVPGVFICADADPPHVHWVSYYWTAALIIETVLLSLSLYKSWQNFRTGAGGNLMRVLTRDSVLYFVVIFCIYAGNQAIWIVNDITINEIGTGFSFCISAILANRLMITVRSKYYTPVAPGEGYTHRSVPENASFGFGRLGGRAVSGPTMVPTIDYRTEIRHGYGRSMSGKKGRSYASPDDVDFVDLDSPGDVGVTRTIRSEPDEGGGVLETIVTYESPSSWKDKRENIELASFSERRGF